jgi:single-stranded-DNA-specific exonuclease
LYTPDEGERDQRIAHIAKSVGVSDITARLLYNRGYDSPEKASAFMNANIESLHDPFLMKDMDKAVQRIAQAIENQETIAIYGDYDVDGVTSVTSIYLYLQSKGADIVYYIPSRDKEGYGLCDAAIDVLADHGVTLIVTVDTGITADHEVRFAAQRGIDMVITDHHECRAELPPACAVVNPHRTDCPYPFKELAGVGVVFKLICAYEIAQYRKLGLPKENAVAAVCREYVDLTAIGTIADVMPLIDENRYIVSVGLEAVQNTTRCGLEALIEASTYNPGTRQDQPQKRKKVTSGFIGFGIAPRINAAGRISSATKAVELLLEQDPETARERAEELCRINTQRQIEENRIAEQAYKKGAASAILAHNHPGGYAFPSEEDVRITRRLCQALEILEIPLLEHYIFADKTYAPVLQRCIAWQGDTASDEMSAVAAPRYSRLSQKGDAERRMAHGREEN